MIIQIRCKTDRITVIVRLWHGYKKDVRIPNDVQESRHKGFAVQVLRDVLNICLS